MSKKTKVSDLPVFDMSEALHDEADIAEYLNLVLAENNPSELAHALGVIAKTKGMASIAEQTGLAREALYKALRPAAHPRFETIQLVCAALGVKLVAQPIGIADSL
jgi:probable addiction module antidote protein